MAKIKLVQFTLRDSTSPIWINPERICSMTACTPSGTSVHVGTPYPLLLRENLRVVLARLESVDAANVHEA